MSILQWNCRGIRSNSEELKVLINETEASVICLQETKLGFENFNPGIKYAFHKSPPVVGERAKGGTGIIIHKSLRFNIISLNTVLQACAVHVFFEKAITLCSIYLEPNLENHLVDETGNRRQLILQDLQELADQLPKPFILMGDFNAKNPLWGEQYCDRWVEL